MRKFLKVVGILFGALEDSTSSISGLCSITMSSPVAVERSTEDVGQATKNGIPECMYTVIFALARTVGWVAHWNEMIEDKNFRIGRPRQLYTGKNKTKYQDIKDR